MFYQPIMLSENKYSLGMRSMADFSMHWHSDLEIMYCLRGSFHVKIDTKDYIVREGEVLFVGSSLPHAYHTCSDDNMITLLRLGSVFFGNDLFMQIAKRQFAEPVIKADEELRWVLDRMTALCDMRAETETENEIETEGLIYLAIAQLLRKLPHGEGIGKRQNKRLNYVLNIQKTLDYVSTNFDKDVSLETAARISGYEKSAFCRIFKQATDTSFHQYLSNYRIQKASILLSQSEKTVSEIAESVGFQELKTFCRVFKQNKGMTPTEYRNQR